MISCDLGSNTIRFVEIDCKTKTRIKEFEKIVKTAEGLKKNKIISQEATFRVIEAIKEAKSIFDFSQKIVAVTTEAVRVAKNKYQFLKKIKEETGVDFKIISGEEEAFFTNFAVKNQIDKKNYMLFDIGGGSTEISLIKNDEIFSKSFDLGIVTLTEISKQNNLKKNLEIKLKTIKTYFKNMHIPQICIFTAGTPTTVAAFLNGITYEKYDYKKINKTILTIDDIKSAKNSLLKLSFEDRKKWVGVGREELIINGIDIFLGLMRLFDFKSCIVIDDGLREGVALYYCD